MIGERLEMSRLNLNDFIVGVLAAKGDREFQLVNIELIATLSDHGPRRQDVVERRETESARREKNREILGVAANGRQ